MARTSRETNLATRAARERLRPNPTPYWRHLDTGLHLGYRKGVRGAKWVVRWYLGEETYKVMSLEGRPDDVLEADGATVLNWSQAQAAARKLYQERQRASAGVEPHQGRTGTVADAMGDYLAAYKAGRTTKGTGRGADRMEWAIKAHILPSLGDVPLARLTKHRLETWLQNLAAAPARLRTRVGADKQNTRPLNPDDPEVVRRRRSSANRVLTILKAALNHALHNGHVGSDDEWRQVKPYRGADAARVRYFSDGEARRLVNACPSDFRALVTAALLTGCRYGELTRLRARDYNPDVGTLQIVTSKSAKPRHVVLTDEGKHFFARAVAGRSASEIILTRDAGRAWGRSEQHRRIADACTAANVAPCTVHALRHTYASRLVMKGVPLAVVAAQLGHKDTRMVEKHYGHLAPSYVADTIRAAFGELGITGISNVTTLRP
jgi:integrase